MKRPPDSGKIDSWMKVAKDLIRPFDGQELDNRGLSAYIEALRKASSKTKLTPAQAGALWNSLEHLKGHAWPYRVLSRNALRVFANWHFIDEATAIPEWDGSYTPADVVFIGVAKLPEVSGELPRYVVAVKLKTGLGAGIIKCSTLPASAMAAFIAHHSGCGRKDRAVEDMAGMEARVMVYYGSDDILMLKQWECTQRQKAHNKDLCAHRDDAAKCGAPIPCSACQRTIRECPLAVWLPAPGKGDDNA